MKIIVNGTACNYERDEITYADVVAIAWGSGRVREPPLMTVTYDWHGEGDVSRSGSLYPSKASIKVADNMIFNAVQTRKKG